MSQLLHSGSVPGACRRAVPERRHTRLLRTARPPRRPALRAAEIGEGQARAAQIQGLKPRQLGGQARGGGPARQQAAGQVQLLDGGRGCSELPWRPLPPAGGSANRCCHVHAPPLAAPSSVRSPYKLLLRNHSARGTEPAGAPVAGANLRVHDGRPCLWHPAVATLTHASRACALQPLAARHPGGAGAAGAAPRRRRARPAAPPPSAPPGGPGAGARPPHRRPPRRPAAAWRARARPALRPARRRTPRSPLRPGTCTAAGALTAPGARSLLSKVSRKMCCVQRFVAGTSTAYKPCTRHGPIFACPTERKKRLPQHW
jgi:hypothetical protein